MVERFQMSDPDQRRTGMAVALACLARNEPVVAPTDTVYGIAVDAFQPVAVERLLDAKRRGRDMPVPVLVGSLAAFRAVTASRGDHGEALVEAFWPGSLTVICQQQPSLQWDLGESGGTVAVRMPDHEVMLELLTRHGPLAVSSANRTGFPPATACHEAEGQLAGPVQVFLDGGPTPGPVPSTIVDLSSERPRVLRVGTISVDALREVVPDLEDVPEPPAGAEAGG